MLTSGDVVDVELGAPEGREAGFIRPAVVVTAQRILDLDPSVIQVVPLTSAVRSFESEVLVDPDDLNGLGVPSAAQCQHIRAVSTRRARSVAGNVGPIVLAQVREAIGVLLDLPA